MTAGQLTISVGMLIARGYREYESQKEHVRSFQKKFIDSKGVMYFIHCEYVSFKWTESELFSAWDFSMQIDTELGAVNISTVQWFNNGGVSSRRTIEQAEQYLHNFWKFNGSPYYEVRHE